MKHPWQSQHGSRPLRPDDVRDIAGCDGRTMAALTRYVALLDHWQPRINLVGRSTLADPWRRHILDSLQLLPLIPPGTATLVDLGSGAGFPGLPLAIAGLGKVHLIESDVRKCAFLHQVNGETGAGVTVIHGRIESVPPFQADVVTARALASLDRLLGYATPFLGAASACLFLKGATAERELTDADKRWSMTATRVPSLTDPAGTVLKLEGIRRRDAG